MEEILVTKKEAAKALSISVRTVEKLIALKKLPVRRIGRAVRISRRAMENFARRDHTTDSNSEDGGRTKRAKPVVSDK